MPGPPHRGPADLRREVAAWEEDRNERGTVKWRFTTADARIKLSRLYPVIEPVNSAVVDH